MDTAHAIILDPRYQEYFAIIKGIRNALVYGAKIRFPHALLMSILFGKGDWKTRMRQILRMTYQHATNLGKFVGFYKALLLAQKKFNGGKERSSDTFFAGLVAGYSVFGSRNAINEQIVLYVCSRVVAAFIPRAGDAYNISSNSKGLATPLPPDSRYFSLFAAVAWGTVMWLFKNKGQTLQPGMFYSMKYLYVDSEHWNSLRTLLWHNT